MSLSSERMAIADRAVRQTFERASIAWQAIPHWETGDPAQVDVRSDATITIAGLGGPPVPAPGAGPFLAGAIRVRRLAVPFQITLGQATAPTPDALLSTVLTHTVALAQEFDKVVLTRLRAPALAPPPTPWLKDWPVAASGGIPTPEEILPALLLGRQLLEDSGYRAGSCLIAATPHFSDLHQWHGGHVAREGLLIGAGADSLFRATQLDRVTIDGGAKDLTIMLGRRQTIAHGRGADASPGEEPVDLAISVPPSLEVIGETTVGGQVELNVRVGFVTRVKDERGVVVFQK
jgi:hypothetical protein